jgi:hypothetical protein
LDAKIEYQLTPEIAEQLVIERATLAFSRISSKFWQLPIPVGLLFAYIFAIASGSMIGFPVGLCFGYGIAWAALTKWLKHLKNQARIGLQKFGTRRKITWDPEFLRIDTEMSQSQIKWQAIDRLVNNKVAIRLYSDDQIIIGIPKAVLPENLDADELIKVWQGYFGKPSKLV